MAAITAEELIQRHNLLRSRRTNFDSQWQQVKDVIWPDGADFTIQRTPGSKTNLEIFDTTPALALENGASAYETFLTPRTQRWHRLVPSIPELREDPAAKDWFERVSDILFQIRASPRARFSSQLHEYYKSNLAYGNGCIEVRDLPTGGVHYRYVHPGCAWIDTDADGVVDTTYHEYKLSARAAVKRWGDQAPKCAHDAIATDGFREHCYLHVVLPNDDFVPGSRNPDLMQFAAYEICVDSKQVMERGGYHEMPYLWGRYTVNPAEVYGRGPGMLILPDIKTLQQMERVFLRSGQKVADPPLLVADDGQLGRGNKTIRLISGGLTMGGLDTQGRALVAPLQTGARLDLTHEMAEARRAIIRRAFFLDYFDVLVQDRVEMTATEVLERATQKGQLLAPVIGRQQEELLGPMIHRELMILQRQGRLPAPPDVLVEAQGEYEIEYESDATRMQKSREATAFARTFETLAPLFQANPSRLSVFKANDSIRTVFEVNGGSSKLVNTEAEMKEIEAAQAEAQQEAQMAEAAPGMAKGVRDLAEARRATAAA